MRLDKFLCDNNIGTRSQVKEYIKKGQVTVNDQIIKKPETKVNEETDTVVCQGQPIHYRKYVYYMLNKPEGVVSATNDNTAPTVVSLLTVPEQKDLFPVGRLDKDTTGLLLLTNDGALAQRLTHPSHEISKTYQVTVQGDVDGAAERLAAMRDLEGEPIAPARVRTLRREGDRALLEITIHQGKNRQIRRMCAQCGLAVPRLRRIREDCLTLGGLRAGTWRDLTPEEVAALKGEAPARGPKGRPGKRA